MTFRSPLLLVAVFVLAACGKPPASESAGASAVSAASLAVTLVPASERELSREVIASGPVSAWEEMLLGVEVSGQRVTALNVEVGGHVKKGQVLLELDHRMVDSDLRQAQAVLDEANAGVQLAQVNLQRGQIMVDDKLISASAFDELHAALVQAQARSATARAQYDGVKLRRDFTELRAPDDGIISRRMVQPGQVVVAGAELLRMIRQGRLEWRAELTAAELARVRPGMAVTLVASSGLVAGKVRAVSPGVDASTRTGTIYADLPAPGVLQAGAFVEGHIVLGTARVLVVPATAVVQRDGYNVVYTVDAGKLVHRLRVRIGATRDGQVEVVEGLAAGVAVVANGAGFLSDGDRVRVVEVAQSP
jgi:RND family efflux transporter MFP subunit